MYMEQQMYSKDIQQVNCIQEDLETERPRKGKSPERRGQENDGI